MNALVTDAAVAGPISRSAGARFGENVFVTTRIVREQTLLTHTLVDPQIDRSKGPAEQVDPEAALHFVRETDRGIVVRGARMLLDTGPICRSKWVDILFPRKPGEERYALCFAIQSIRKV